jgi:hypothetical protein
MQNRPSKSSLTTGVILSVLSILITFSFYFGMPHYSEISKYINASYQTTLKMSVGDKANFLSSLFAPVALVWVIIGHLQQNRMISYQQTQISAADLYNQRDILLKCFDIMHPKLDQLAVRILHMSYVFDKSGGPDSDVNNADRARELREMAIDGNRYEVYKYFFVKENVERIKEKRQYNSKPIQEYIDSFSKIESIVDSSDFSGLIGASIIETDAGRAYTAGRAQTT